MTPERWQQVARVYQSAVEQPARYPSRHLRQSRDANASRFEHDEASSKTIAETGDGIDDRLTERGSRGGGKSNQHNTRRAPPPHVRELAEVLVLGQEDAFFGTSDGEYSLVMRTGIDFTNRGNVVAACPERVDDGEVTALIGKKLHALLSRRRSGVPIDEHNLLVRDGVSRVAHRGVNVLASKQGIGIQKIRLGRALAEFAQNQFDRNPGPANYGLAEHDTRIDFDAIRDRHSNRIHPVPRPMSSTLVPSSVVS